MRRRRLAPAETAAAGSFLALVAGGLLLLAGNWSTVDRDDVFGSAVLGWLIMVGYGGVGTLLVLRLRRHRVSLLFPAVGRVLAGHR